MVNTSNPRYANGHRRRNLRTRILHEETHYAICGHEVDKTLPTPHPYSPEIDEIIPISLGGNPLDRKNCRLVHRECNRCRSTGKHTGRCTWCHNTFTGIAAFDKHRAGKHDNDTRHCLNPATVGLIDAGRNYPCWGHETTDPRWVSK